MAAGEGQLLNQHTQERQRLFEVEADVHDAAAWLLAEQRAEEIKAAQAKEREFLLAKKAAAEIKDGKFARRKGITWG